MRFSIALAAIAAIAITVSADQLTAEEEAEAIVFAGLVLSCGLW